ncbi:hypothetical protein TWF281_004707 [Arthrobotrys megalospora]
MARIYSLLTLLLLTFSTAQLLNVTVHTPTQNIYLQRSPSGSLVFWQYNTTTPPATLVSNNSLISRDIDGRYLIYFPSEIQATNLSRVLLQPIDQIPLGARAFQLTYMQGTGNLDGVFIGTDTLGNGMYLIACTPKQYMNNITLIAARNSPFPPEVQFTVDSNLPYLPFTTLGFPQDGCGAVTLVAEGVNPLAWGSVAPDFVAISQEDNEYAG